MKEFKKGDFVRIVKDPYFDIENTWVEKGDIGEVTNVEVGNVLCVDFHPSTQQRIFPSQYDLVERIDPKTAFLNNLSELLRKYDAKIDLGFAGHAGENPYINIALGDNGDIEWTDSTFYNKDFKFPLTADNVLNYDK